MTQLDTSVLIDCFTGSRASFPQLIRLLDRGERLELCSIVLYEWFRGPRTRGELEDQERLFPGEKAIPFDAAHADLAAKLYRAVKRARSREADIAIAACAIHHEAQLWTLNRPDFADIPELRLFSSF